MIEHFKAAQTLIIEVDTSISIIEVPVCMSQIQQSNDSERSQSYKYMFSYCCCFSLKKTLIDVKDQIESFSEVIFSRMII